MKPFGKFLLVLLLLAGLGAGAWLAFPSFRSRLTLTTLRQAITEDLPEKITETVPVVEQALDRVAETAEQISTPGPLISKLQAARTPLTRAGTFEWTNVQRTETGGLPALAASSDLDRVAELRLRDMFDRQYFAHESPTGTDAAGAAKMVGYDYLAIGENIALGNFGDDRELVQAWMDSPGHRANILSTGYTELGIAVGQGTYEGRTTWIGVQIFGKPSSACPQPNAALKARIDGLNAEIARLNQQAEGLAVELERRKKPRSQEEVDEYNRQVEQYNGIVTVLNGTAAETKKLIEQYNVQVRELNACINS